MLRNHHVAEVYKRDRLALEIPRRGDRAAVVRDHHNNETGLIVVVVNDPHLCEQYCAECGQKIVDYFVEVSIPLDVNDLEAIKCPGPYFYPVSWLRRILPIRAN